MKHFWWIFGGKACCKICGIDKIKDNKDSICPGSSTPRIEPGKKRNIQEWLDQKR